MPEGLVWEKHRYEGNWSENSCEENNAIEDQGAEVFFVYCLQDHLDHYRARVDAQC